MELFVTLFANRLMNYACLNSNSFFRLALFFGAEVGSGQAFVFGGFVGAAL
jgi:hypothetical protein